MKCPKCGYLGFEHVDRCRNCGYDFSLSPSSSLSDLPIREEADLSPLDDFAMVDAAGPVHPAAFAPETSVGSVDSESGGISAREPSGDLPLFATTPVPDDVPLITKVSPPRAPLAVRRATPEPARLRVEPRLPALDLAPDPEDRAPVAVEERAFTAEPPRTASPADVAPAEDAGFLARLAAVAIDLTILAAIDAAVVYFTMQICGLKMADVNVLPRGPLLAFLLVQNGGYLVAFTAGGQTLGKMAAGIRVVGAEPGDTVDLGRAMLRELLWLVLAIPAGLGFLSAFLSADHRGLHDRFAGTRVIRLVV
ncbi:MAG: RDD family protein [Betaproteobacteria bacterium]